MKLFGINFLILLLEMRTLFSITFLAVFSFPVFAQQTMLFSQYLMNLYGINPAVGGTQLCWDFRIGYRKQWAGFP
ncbi:MAG: hypothetical protein COA57_05995 [Flavobacteriales bacterium]|nr:MAG: hypothetical protein COA57_05995 [Flavobacteriales bacterium]